MFPKVMETRQLSLSPSSVRGRRRPRAAPNAKPMLLVTWWEDTAEIWIPFGSSPTSPCLPQLPSPTPASLPVAGPPGVGPLPWCPSSHLDVTLCMEGNVPSGGCLGGVGSECPCACGKAVGVERKEIARITMSPVRLPGPRSRAKGQMHTDLRHPPRLAHPQRWNSPLRSLVGPLPW